MRKRFCLIGWIALAALIFPACVPQNYLAGQGEDTKKEGEAMLRDYLDARYSQYELTNVRVVTGESLNESFYGGAYLTACVSAEFVAGDTTNNILVDTETKTIYSTEMESDVYAYLSTSVQELFAEAGYTAPIAVVYCGGDLYITNHQVPNKKQAMDTEAELSGYYPTNIQTEDIPAFLERGMDEIGWNSIWIVCADDSPQNIPVEAFQSVLDTYTELQLHGTIRVIRLSAEEFEAIQNGEEYTMNMKSLEERSYPE